MHIKKLETFLKTVRLNSLEIFFALKNCFKTPRFDEVMSLGYNCETSFRIKGILKNKFNHYLYSWLYISDRIGFLNSLDNPVYYSDCDFEILPWGMMRGLKTGFSFHPNEEKELRENIQNCDIEKIKNNLKNKISHLANKTHNLINSDKRILFVIKIIKTSLELDIDYIKKINEILNKNCSNKDYKLLCVFEKRCFKIQISS